LVPQPANVQLVFKPLLEYMRDYEIDRRSDVGSWSCAKAARSDSNDSQEKHYVFANEVGNMNNKPLTSKAQKAIEA
jgi:hypothetical protein